MTEEQRIKRLEHVLGTLITWIAQSSASPISITEAQVLLRDLIAEPNTTVEE